jgi:hypothetical protein
MGFSKNENESMISKRREKFIAYLDDYLCLGKDFPLLRLLTDY